MYHSQNEPVTFVRDCPAVLIPAGEKTIGHRTFYVTELWKALLPELLERSHGR